MAKKTIEKEYEVTETKTEEETLWTCDDCCREFAEDELREVAVEPEAEPPSNSEVKRKSDIEWAMRDTSRWREQHREILENVRGGDYSMQHEEQFLLEKMESSRDEIVRNLIQEVQEMQSFTAASTLDVCPECLEDNYGITVAEHGGELFEERNYNETIEKSGLDSFSRKSLVMGIAILFATFYIMGASGGPWIVAAFLILTTSISFYWVMG